MGAIKEGTKAVLTRGRRAGNQVEIVKVIDVNFVEVKDAKGKQRRCNIHHLEPRT
ncbi:MAG: 50S ribosomal protein L14e [Candidatus Micrarchaeia archaeon]